MKKHLLLLFAALLPMLASAQTKVEIDGIWYNLDESAKQAEVTFKGDYYISYSGEYSGSITIPAIVTYGGVTYSVTSIGARAFWDCSSLTAINIPESVTSIGNEAFGGTAWLSSQPDGVIYAGKVLYAYKGTMPENTNIEVREGTKGIAGGAFYYCRSLTAITIPEGVTSIGRGAFYYCRSLTAITLPESVTSIEPQLFEYCSSLTAITLPEGVTSIGECAFHSCSSLTTINIPKSVTSIGGSAFAHCRSLTSIPLPESVTSIEGYAFEDCSSLTAVTLPESVTSIEWGVFAYCSSLTAITIPEGVTSIGGYAFLNCSSLTAIDIPEGVTSIGFNAFDGCSRLTDVYCYAEEVPTTETNAFNNSNIENATLHVPANALNAYKTTSPWSNFGTIVSLTDEEMGIKNSELNIQNPELIYDLRGRRVEKAEKGIYIVNGKKTVIK